MGKGSEPGSGGSKAKTRDNFHNQAASRWKRAGYVQQTNEGNGEQVSRWVGESQVMGRVEKGSLQGM